MRVLLYADDCNPEMASEPGFTFRTIRSIIDHVDDALVVTQTRNEAAIAKTDMGGATVVYLDTEYVARPAWKVSKALRLGTSLRTATKYPVQYAFERELWKRFSARIGQGEFDIVHRVGPISSALPSPLATWSKAPFVIGPVNGGLPYPPAFSEVLRREGEWLRYVRGANRLLPYLDATYRNAAAILAAYDHTVARIPPGNSDRVINFPEVGADPARFSGAPRNPGKTRLDFVFVGRLVPFKCADVAVSAFAASDMLRGHRLTIIGDGPERARLEALVEKHGLADCVTLAGWLPQDQVARTMQDADVFVFPSIRDSGAGVVAEAMLAGLVSVVVDYGPGHHLIDEASGIRVPLGTREDHIAGFRTALEALVADPTRRIAMGEAAHNRAATRLSWDARARRIVEIYRWVLGERLDKPLGPLEG
jgi:glycosyltransferase involved in cell wall biosynthesis